MGYESEWYATTEDAKKLCEKMGFENPILEEEFCELCL